MGFQFLEEIPPLHLQILEELNLEEGTISFKWYKGHAATVGNIQADYQATLGLLSTEPPIQLCADISLLALKHPRLNTTIQCGEHILSPRLLSRIRKESGSAFPKLVRLITGHFRQRFSWSLDPQASAGKCPLCQANFRSFNHWFSQCVNWVDTCKTFWEKSPT